MICVRMNCDMPRQGWEMAATWRPADQQQLVYLAAQGYGSLSVAIIKYQIYCKFFPTITLKSKMRRTSWFFSWTRSSLPLFSIEKAILSLLPMFSQSCGLLSWQEFTSQAGTTSCLTSGPQNWSILLYNSSELTEHGSTALDASEIYRDMCYV